MQGHFPEAEKDSVIQIASLVSVLGQPEPAVKNIITLNTCSSIVGAEVPTCPSALRPLRSLHALLACQHMQRKIKNLPAVAVMLTASSIAPCPC